MSNVTNTTTVSSNTTESFSNVNVELYTNIFWPAAVFYCILLLSLHILLHICCSTRKRPGLKIYPAVPDYQEIIIEDDVEVENEWHSKQSMIQILADKLLKVQRPLLLDIILWIAILLLIVCVLSGSKIMVVAAGAFAVYDFAQLMYIMTVLYNRIKDIDIDLKGLRIVHIGYCLLCGFPIGTGAKILIAIWYDGYVSLDVLLKPHIWIFGVGAIVFASMFITCSLCAINESLRKDYACFFAVIAIPIAVVVYSAAIGVALIKFFYSQAYLRSNNIEVIWAMTLEPSGYQGSPWTLVMLACFWAPALVLSCIFVYIVTTKQIAYWFIPDYLTLWGFTLSSFFLAYHMETFPKTGVSWLNIGVPCYPLMLSFIGVMAFHIYDCYHSFHKGILIWEHQQIRLPRVKGVLRSDIERIVKNTWYSDQVGCNGDLDGTVGNRLQYSDMEIADIGKIHNPDLWDRYNMAKDNLREAKYEEERPVKLELMQEHGKTISQKAKTETFDTHMLDGVRDHYMNEQFLFHCTSSVDNVKGICLEGFDLTRSPRTYYGKGVYLTEDSSKADQYGAYDRLDNIYMLVVRVCLGTAHINKDISADFDKAPCAKPTCAVRHKNCPDRTHGCDSVVSQCTSYREYMIFDECLCFPEFLVIYNRK